MNKKEALGEMIQKLEELEDAFQKFKEAQVNARKATEQFCSVMENELLNFEYYTIGDAEI